MFISYTYVYLPDEQSAPVSERAGVCVFLSYDETCGILALWEKKYYFSAWFQILLYVDI